MDLDTQIQGIWIAIGVLSGLGILLAFAQTTVWQSRAGKELIDLVVRKYSFVFLLNKNFIFYKDYWKITGLYM